MKAEKSTRVNKRVCLYAAISFDGRLLDAAAPLPGGSVPGWWVKLIGRRCCQTVVADTVRALFEAGGVDELCLRVCPRVDGRRSQPTLSGPGGDAPFFARSIIWELVRMAATADGDCLLHYRRATG